jgi:hypothetical protein
VRTVEQYGMVACMGKGRGSEYRSFLVKDKEATRSSWRRRLEPYKHILKTFGCRSAAGGAVSLQSENR